MEWCERRQHASLVLWWAPRGHRPDIEEAMTRLDWLRNEGPSERAFNFGKPFPPAESR